MGDTVILRVERGYGTIVAAGLTRDDAAARADPEQGQVYIEAVRLATRDGGVQLDLAKADDLVGVEVVLFCPTCRGAGIETRGTGKSRQWRYCDSGVCPVPRAVAEVSRQADFRAHVPSGRWA